MKKHRPIKIQALLDQLPIKLWREFHGKSCDGFSLLEILICVALLGLLSIFATQGFNQQIANHQLDHLALSFVQDAQLARQMSQQRRQTVSMKPLAKGYRSNWTAGWEIKTHSIANTIANTIENTSLVKSYINTTPIEVAEHLLNPSQQFADMSAPGKERHISFTDGAPALLHNGGFVANRIIWQHSQYPELIRHIILGPGGRWRICNPVEDKKDCQ
jgi:type IV fimbrial biogenesis protein FimT